MDDLTLFTDGQVSVGERQFTRLMGGFGEDKPMFTIFQAGELLGLRTGDIRDNFERNESDFEDKIDFIDLKSANAQNVSGEIVDITKVLKSLGYSQNKLNATKQWLAFSFSGMMKLVKIATTKESWNIYNNFLEDYFKTKAENKVLKNTLAEEKDFLLERKKFILGSMFMEQEENKRLEFFQENEKLGRRIMEIEVSLKEENIMEKLNPQLSIAKTFMDSKGYYDMNTFSKCIDIDGLGRNNMFQWLRSQKILMNNNQPYQKNMDYFKVLAVSNNNGFTTYKTVIKPKGIEFIFNKLIKDGKIIPKTLEEVMEKLSESEVA